VEGEETFSQQAGRCFFSPALIALEDGSHYLGRSLGATGEACGEVVFNTSMSGYQEILTDPSYKGQIVVMTYPQIGNYGVRGGDSESRGTFLEGFVVREYTPSLWASGGSDLDSFLRESGVVSIQGVDTRALVRRVRTKGAMRGIISTLDLDPVSLHERVLRVQNIGELDLVRQCSCESPSQWNGSREKLHSRGLRVAVYDFGAKRGILNSLSSLGIEVTVVPHDFSPEEVLSLGPDGVVLSNGPGDPEVVSCAIHSVSSLMGEVPLLGICLGHQIICLALGVKIHKLKFGHHGANHPVRDLRTNEVKITSQNHNYAADAESIKECGAEVTHTNLYDGTVEGMIHEKLSLFGVQFHPEACPGPNDSRQILGDFVETVKKHAQAR
jgi:carbamoyl-phosphate synthase small subunit